MTPISSTNGCSRLFAVCCILIGLVALDIFRTGSLLSQFQGATSIGKDSAKTTGSHSDAAVSAKPQQHPLNQETTDQQEPRVLLTTFVFGQAAAEKRYLHMFAESARCSGVDVLIVGDPVPPFFLTEDTTGSLLSPPPNVRHLRITWNELIDRLETKILNGTSTDFTPSSDHRKSPPRDINNTGPVEGWTLRLLDNYYKVIDYKPLFAALFPEQVASYDWWGHVDNDVILGDVRHILSVMTTTNRTVDLLHEYDIIGGVGNEYTWGPFTLYRNTPLNNELFRYAERPLIDIFGTPWGFFFDEWGGGATESERRFYSSTMSGIIDKYRHELGIRWHGGLPVGWDGFCAKEQRSAGHCNECHLIRYSSASTITEKHTPQGRQQQQSQWQQCTKQRLIQICVEQGGPCQKHVMLCHFQHSKATMENSLKLTWDTDEADTPFNYDKHSFMKHLWKTNRLRVNYGKGFASLPANINHSEEDND